MQHEEPRVYTIREVAAQFHMQPSTLRYYEEQGLLTNVGRTASGQRIYEECHINRLRAICCFKNAGMTIEDLKKFFIYEQDEPAHIDEILALLESRRKTLDEQRRALNEAAMHVQRKLHYYGDIKRALDAGERLPDWGNYKTHVYSIDC
ncbi:MerR family transcriptional regulator [Bifidobacterium scaligerum]|uniref:MerR family transcriptional regulator n=2 Tax=Bifidobacterium scaligerum TaxID=2052656 RepID=A0A2M9HP44_9BIFI|nr:MerR family transcriptional regulator [Bifidobacterium scaligerum]